MMRSRGNQHSNSPTGFEPGKRAWTADSSRDLAAKGLVSTRLHAYQVHAQQADDVAPAYPPSFPRARFTRVQTQGGWPSHNADLYNQEHPRTMSLACESSQYDTNISQGRQYEYTARGESQARSITSNGPRVTNLLHLWESQGPTHRAPPSRRPSHTASPWRELASADQTPQGDHHSYRAKPSTEAFEIPHLTHLPLLHFNLLSLRSARQQTVRSEDLSRTPDKAPSEVPTETATYSMSTCKRTRATDSNDNVSMTNSNHQPTSSTPVTEEGCSSSDSSQATERRMPIQSTRLVSGWQQSGMQSPDEGLESNGQQPLECTIRSSSRSNGCLKTFNRAHTRIRSGRHAERSDQERGLLMPRGLGSGGECPHRAGTFEVPDMQRPHDMYGTLSSAEAKVALRGNPPPSSCSRSPEVPLISRNEFPCRTSSALTSSTPSSLLDLSVRRLRG